MRHQQDFVCGVERRNRALSEVVLAVENGSAEMRAQMFYDRSDRCCIERVFELRIIARRQRPHSAGAWSQQGIQEIRINLVALRDEVTEIVRLLDVQKDPDVAAGNDQICERYTRIAPCLGEGLSEVNGNAGGSQTALGAVHGVYVAARQIAVSSSHQPLERAGELFRRYRSDEEFVHAGAHRPKNQ